LIRGSVRLNLLANLQILRNIMTKHKGKFAFADFSEENMPEIINNTFRIFTPHKPEKNRVDNGKDGIAFNMYKDTVFDYPSVIQSKLDKSWDLYNKLLSCQVALCDFHCWHCYVPDELLRGGSKINYLTPKELVDGFLAEKKQHEQGKLRSTCAQNFWWRTISCSRLNSRMS
jgi:hypothetical protein